MVGLKRSMPCYDLISMESLNDSSTFCTFYDPSLCLDDLLRIQLEDNMSTCTQRPKKARRSSKSNSIDNPATKALEALRMEMEFGKIEWEASGILSGKKSPDLSAVKKETPGNKAAVGALENGFDWKKMDDTAFGMVASDVSIFPPKAKLLCKAESRKSRKHCHKAAARKVEQIPRVALTTYSSF